MLHVEPLPAPCRGPAPGVEEPDRERITLVAVLHALSDPTRLAVVRQLVCGGETLCGRLDVAVAKSTLSQHLRVLREAGVTRTRPEGTQRWLSVRREDLDACFPGLLDVVLTAVTSPPVDISVDQRTSAMVEASSGAVSVTGA